MSHSLIYESDPLAMGFLPLLRASQQQKFDQIAIEKFGITGFTLMESAGKSATSIIEREFGAMRGRRVVICCGGGNNGGDGFVVARFLYTHGAHVHVKCLKRPSSPESKQNLLLLEQLKSLDPSNRLILDHGLAESLPDADLYVDALFGVGLNRPLLGKVAALVRELNTKSQPIVALDLPSGLHGDTGEPLGVAVRADLTITFSAYKGGLLFGNGSTYSGRTELVSIGLPPHLVLDASEYNVDWITTDRSTAILLPSRNLSAHKYSVGMVLVIGGSPGFSGAPMLAARAAARAGAGYVACAAPKSIQGILASAMTEIPTIGLSECSDGGIDTGAALHEIRPWLQKANALVIGPGLGRSSNTEQFTEAILQASKIPIVVDADALVVASRMMKNSDSEKSWILTPHAGEFERMIGNEVPDDRLDSVREWSSKWNCTLVLKGSPTLIGHTHHEAVVCGTGNPALATAGTGDVLAGLCGGLIAQGCTTSIAAICASHVGGLAADLYSQNRSSGTMIAGDLVEGITDAITFLRNNSKWEPVFFH